MAVICAITASTAVGAGADAGDCAEGEDAVFTGTPDEFSLCTLTHALQKRCERRTGMNFLPHWALAHAFFFNLGEDLDEADLDEANLDAW